MIFIVSFKGMSSIYSFKFLSLTLSMPISRITILDFAISEGSSATSV